MGHRKPQRRTADCPQLRDWKESLYGPNLHSPEAVSTAGALGVSQKGAGGGNRGLFTVEVGDSARAQQRVPKSETWGVPRGPRFDGSLWVGSQHSGHLALSFQVAFAYSREMRVMVTE